MDEVASNRRYPLPDGTISYHRTSASTAPEAHVAPEGTIDPWLTTLSFWNGQEPILALSHYAVHPMSYYGRGGVSADFVGIARRARQRTLPEVVQVYVSGMQRQRHRRQVQRRIPGQPPRARRKDGSRDGGRGRPRALAPGDGHVAIRSPLVRAAAGPGYSEADLIDDRNDPKPYGQCLAAMGLSWRRRNVASGEPIDLPVLDLGRGHRGAPARRDVRRIPAARAGTAARRRRDRGGVTASLQPGYIPTSLQIAEGDENLGDWYWVSETAEQILTDGLERALAGAPD